MTADSECSRPDCHQPHKAKGLCMRHYGADWRADPANKARKNAADRRYGREHRRAARERMQRHRESRSQ